MAKAPKRKKYDMICKKCGGKVRTVAVATGNKLRFHAECEGCGLRARKPHDIAITKTIG